MFALRPFDKSENDYKTLAGIHNIIWPEEPLTPAMFAYFDQVRNPNYLFQRLILEVNSQPVGYANYQENYWSYRPGKYGMSVNVLPEHRGKGVGSHTYAYILEQLDAQTVPPRLIESGTREDYADARRFLDHRGFQGPIMRWPLSKLDVATFDPTRFRRQSEGLADHGLRIYSFQELSQIDPDWQERIYDLDWEGTQDEPMPDAPTRLSFEEYAERVFSGPGYLADGCFIAVDETRPDRRYVGLTQLFMDSGEMAHLATGFTTVRRAYRQRGVAIALKVHAIEWARRQGTQSILTGNEEHNPMYQINLKMGYEPQPAGVHYHKVIDPTILNEVEMRTMDTISAAIAEAAV